MRSIKYRAHEWLADHFAGIQYPAERPPQRRPIFRYQMPAIQRVFIVVMCMSSIAASLAVLAVILYFGYFIFLA